MAMPSVSVVIPTRNRRHLLARALCSTLGQLDVELEAIIVDDASNDGTGDFVRGLDDARVTVVRHDAPRGVAAARNNGLARAAAPWVAFLDDDDLWAPSKLAVQLRTAAERGAAWICAGAVIVDDALRIIGGGPPSENVDIRELLAMNVIPGGGSGVLMRTELARAVGGFDENLRILADWDMWIRLFLETPPAVVPRPLVAYQWHPHSMSHVHQGFAEELDQMDEKYTDIRRGHGVALARDRWLRWTAARHLHAGNRVAAIRAYVRVAARSRDVRSFVRVFAVGLVPKLVLRLRSRRSRRAVPVSWLEEAEAWLASIGNTGLPRSKIGAGERVSAPPLRATVG